MELFRITTSLWGENCFIYSDGKECVVFDPGYDHENIIDFIKSKNLTVKYICLTHCHFDHFGAVCDLVDEFKSKVYCHYGDQRLMEESNDDIHTYGLPKMRIPFIDVYVQDGDTIMFNDIKMDVLHTPGHSEGSVCYYIASDKLLISGDTIFFESIGRTDFPYGNTSKILSSIKDKIYKLPDGVKICPGHGEYTTVGHEKEFNPFVRI